MFYMFNVSLLASYEALVESVKRDFSINLKTPYRTEITHTLTADKFEFNLINRRIVGSPFVKVDYGNMKTTSDKIIYYIDSDKIIIQGNALFQQDKLSLKSQYAEFTLPSTLFVKDSVALNYETYSSISDSAFYFIDQKIIKFAGNVEFTESLHNDYVTGETVVFDLSKKDVLATGRSKLKVTTQRLEE